MGEHLQFGHSGAALIQTIREIVGLVDIDPAGDEQSFVHALRTITEKRMPSQPNGRASSLL